MCMLDALQRWRSIFRSFTALLVQKHWVFFEACTCLGLQKPWFCTGKRGGSGQAASAILRLQAHKINIQKSKKLLPNIVFEWLFCKSYSWMLWFKASNITSSSRQGRSFCKSRLGIFQEGNLSGTKSVDLFMFICNGHDRKSKACSSPIRTGVLPGFRYFGGGILPFFGKSAMISKNLWMTLP